jgi:hypothetical protein
MTFPWEQPDPIEQIAQRTRELDVPEFLRRDTNNRAPWMLSPATDPQATPPEPAQPSATTNWPPAS